MLLHKTVPPARCLLSSGIGALFSLVILLPKMPFFLSAIIKSVSTFILSIIAFGKGKGSEIIINTLCLLVISFVYAGAMLALWLFAAPFDMYCCNGAVYFNLPIIAVALFTIASYAVIKLLRYISDRRCICTSEKQVTITTDQGSATLKGVADTGNTLCDPFSRKPALICSAEAISELLPENIKVYLSGRLDNIEGIRLAPCSTVSGETLIPVFSAVRITVDGITVDAVVGVCSKPLGAECIYNPRMIIF